MIRGMSDPAIRPSAQRLAEANNVDWRALEGSGDGGRIVEDDVLGYLTQVMRGEAATDPTPEPLPEGVSAWPEEPERRPRAAPVKEAPAEGAVAAVFSAPFTVSEVQAPPSPPKLEADSPWTLPSESPVPKSGPQRLGTPDAPSPFDLPFEVSRPQGEPPTPEGVGQGAVVAPQAAADASPPSEPAPSEPGVPEHLHNAVLGELRELKEKLEVLERERLRHVEELHQLSRLQETIALQQGESAKLGALQREVGQLKEALAEAQREAQTQTERAAELEARVHDLEARLTRARAFRAKAKAEFERVVADNVMLEREVLELRGRSRWWGRRKAD